MKYTREEIEEILGRFSMLRAKWLRAVEFRGQPERLGVERSINV